MNKNDERVLEYKKEIADLEEKLENEAKKLKFTPVTNCSIRIGGTGYNLNVLNKNELTGLLVTINMYRLSEIDLGVKMELCGYSTDQWIQDIKSKLSVLEVKDKQEMLKKKKKELDKLLSEEKRTELELDSIGDFLKTL